MLRSVAALATRTVQRVALPPRVCIDRYTQDNVYSIRRVLNSHFSTENTGYLAPTTTIRKPVSKKHKKKPTSSHLTHKSRYERHLEKQKYEALPDKVKADLRRFPHESYDLIVKQDPTTMLLLEKKYNENFSRERIDYDELLQGMLADPGQNATEEIAEQRARAVVDVNLFFKRNKGDYSTGQFHILLFNQAYQGRSDLQEHTLQLMKEHDTPVDSKAITAQLTALSRRSCEASDVHSLLASMRTLHVTPDTQILGAAVNALAKNGASDSARDLIKTFEYDYGIQANQVTYTSLVNGYVREKKLDAAWDAHMQSMMQHGPGDVVMITTLIHACALQKDAPRALELFQDIITAGDQPTEVTFTALAHACARRPDYFQKSLEMLDRMKGFGLKMDQRAYHVMLNACAQLGHTDFAEEVATTMMEEYAPDQITLGTLLSVYKNAQLWGDVDAWNHNIERAHEILYEMFPAHGLTPNAQAVNIYLGVLANANRLHRSQAFVDKGMYDDFAIQPDLYSHRFLLNMYLRARRYQEIKACLDRGVAAGIKWEQVDYLRILRKVRSRTKDLPLALELLVRLPKEYPASFTLDERSVGTLQRRIQRHAPQLQRQWDAIKRSLTQGEPETFRPIRPHMRRQWREWAQGRKRRQGVKKGQREGMRAGGQGSGNRSSHKAGAAGYAQTLLGPGT